VNGVEQFLSFFPSGLYSVRLIKCAQDERDLTRAGSVEQYLNVVGESGVRRKRSAWPELRELPRKA